MDSTSCPDFVREVAFFCCRNTNQMQELGLSFNTIVLGHEVAALRFDDKTALKWLIENNANEHLRRSRTRIYLQKAVDEKIPLALRLEADRISSKSFISPKAQQKAQAEIAQLLQEAAEGGDAEAQCRQGETLLRNKTPEDWRHRTCEWFLKAANQGHERATVHLGQLFAEEKPMEAIRWLKQVAENPEADASLRASAECELGKLYLRRQQLADAANHLRTAAQNNNRAAMKLLALEPNLRGTLSDEEIQKWCLSLLKQKETDGQDDKSFRSQVLTRLGQVAKSKTERADWFRQAAEAGDGPGAYEWARCLLFDGKLQEANTWFQEAQKRCQDHLDGNRDLAAQAEAWHNCVYSMISEPIPPVPAQKRRELFIKTEPRP
jgi:TPR repeat protein